MNGKIIELIIEIYYGKEKLSIRVKNQIELEEIKKRTIQKFSIVQTINKIYFTYIDEEGYTNKIHSIEDIYISAKKEENSDNYISTIYLEIEKAESETVNEELNNNNKSQNAMYYIKEKKELEKQYEKIKIQNEQKIKELEDIIEKMKNQHLEEINKIKNENSENYHGGKINHNDQSDKILIKNGMENMENIITNLFYKEKNNLIETIKTMKKEMISEIKEEFKNVQIIYDNYKDIKDKLNNINTDIKDNTNKIQNIQNDLGKVKESISKIEEKQENQKQLKNKNNKEKNYINNSNNNYPFNIGNHYISMTPFINKMPVNKIYMCSNCKIPFIFNECFDTINNKHYNEHSFKLQNYENNNIFIKENNNEENNVIKNNNIINDDFENDKKEDNNKEFNEKDEEIKNNEKNKDEKEKQYYNIYYKFNSLLNNYFFHKDGKLKIDNPSETEKNLINGLYINLLEKSLSIKDIEEYQNNYIIVEINPVMEKLGNKKLKKFINRLDTIKKLIKDLNN